MENIIITRHRGFSAVEGETGLIQVIEEIRSGKHAPTIKKITTLAASGHKPEAEKVKKTLPYLSLTANYTHERLPYSLVRYNPAVTIDIDGLERDQLTRTEHLLKSDPNILACFRSPKQHGLKCFVYLTRLYACRLRDLTFSTPTITYAELEKYHAVMYELCRGYVEELTGVEVDTSGSDLSRGFFSSWDPDAYLNRELLASIPDCTTRVIPPKKEEKKKKTAAKSAKSAKAPAMPPVSSVPSAVPSSESSVPPALSSSIEPWEQMEYRKALSTTRRTDHFEAGNRDNFLYILGNRCYRKGICEASACALVSRDFSACDMDVLAPIHNAYTYTGKTDAAEKKKKEEKKPVVAQVMQFLETHYDIRRNVILDRLEFLPLTKSGAGEAAFRPMRVKDYNSIFVEMQMAGIVCFQTFLRAVIDSDFARDFNPFRDYLDSLPAWDGTDYIGRLAATVRTDDQPLWEDGFRRWIVGMVACALNEGDMNQLVLILYSEQGKGKSSWIRHLLPPILKEYYYNGMIDPGNKDHAQLLSTRLVINMEEFEGVKPGELAELKRIITQENVTQRKVYDLQAYTFVRHASFIGSTNNRQCLQDVSGNRRFLPVTILDVDYRTPVYHGGVYAQALALLKDNFRFWYEGSEIEHLNAHNELHRMKDPVEENLLVYFRKPLPEDLAVKWMPAAAILSKLAIYGKIQVNRQAMQSLVLSLELHSFRTRRNSLGSTEYEVVDLQQDEVDRNFRQV